MKNVETLKKLWFEEKPRYLKAERGSQGNEGFCKVFFEQVLSLVENNSSSHKLGTFKNQIGTQVGGRTADFIIYASPKVVIPVEVEKLNNIKAGEVQILKYQDDLDTRYGILTDGLIWRFFYGTKIVVFDLEKDIFGNLESFLNFWQSYIDQAQFYSNYFNGELFETLFEKEIKPQIDNNRDKYFLRTTKLTGQFRDKLMLSGFTKGEKKATELAYSYLIQFILFKTLVDNGHFVTKYKEYVATIKLCLDKIKYSNIIKTVKSITDTVGGQIYKPFFQDQELINKNLTDLLFSFDEPKLEDVALFLDIIVYVDSFSFEGLEGDIFGFVYENYLKELYSEENRAQFFTDPNIAAVMLNEMGWNQEELIEKLQKQEFDNLSIIDPACGSGTFLYSATNTLVLACKKAGISAQKTIDLVVENITGFDIEEFALYLAEMNILMQLLPLIYQDFKNPKAVEKRLKIFWTEDSLSEFVDIYEANKNTGSLFEPFVSQEVRLMRDENQLLELKEELLENDELKKIKRQKFAFVIANPPYIEYNQLGKFRYFSLRKEGKVSLNDVFGINLHSVPNNRKTYSPKPNLYAFFVALANALLKDGGKFSYLIPQTLLTANDLDVIRYGLCTAFSIDKLTTFEDNLFTNRGVKVFRDIATSSMIVLATKKGQNQEVEIINYPKSNKIQNSKKTIKKLTTEQLLVEYVNWNWIKYSKEDLKIQKKYKKNSQSLEIYYDHNRAKKVFDTEFWFDGCFKIDKNNITLCQKNNPYHIFKQNESGWNAWVENSTVEKINIKVPDGSQGWKFNETKYRIIWRKTNPKNFMWYENSKQNTVLHASLMGISSDNKDELLYLLALLNSKLNTYILNLYVKNEHEKSKLYSLKSVKNFVRVPIIDTAEKEQKKQKVIQLAQELLDLEKLKLGALIDFDINKLLPPTFSSWSIFGQELVLDNKHKFKILKKPSLVKDTLENTLLNNNFSLNELKEIFVTADLSKLKEEMDKIIEELYGLNN